MNHKRVSELVLADVSHSDFLFGELADSRVKVSLGSVASRAWVDSLFKGAEEISVFHLASIMSMQTCLNLERQLRVFYGGGDSFRWWWRKGF